MRKFLFILIFCFFSQTSIFGQPIQTEDWKWQNPFPQGNNLSDVQFLNAQTGWAVAGGILMKTSNGGSSWIRQSTGTVQNLNSIHFIDAQNGWIVGATHILKTNNGGSSWSSLSNPGGIELHSVYFTDVQNGWALGRADNNNGTILKTSNGGESWISQFTSGPQFMYLSSVQFTDAQNGWVVGASGTILKTSNGGSSWQSQISGTSEYLISVYFSNALNGWAVGTSGTLLKTTNGGSNWVGQSSGITNDLYSVQFIDAQTGWAVGWSVEMSGVLNSIILKTSNGGSSWTSQSIGSTLDFCFSLVHFTNAQTGWVMGFNGKILKTTNGGSSWISQSNAIVYRNLKAVHFTDAHTGWAVGEFGNILKTSNGGRSWLNQISGTTRNLWSVYFTDAQNGWSVGKGTILKTSNGGGSWIPQITNIDTNNYLEAVHFIDAQNGWAFGWATILKTSNGGSSWIRLNSTPNTFAKDVQFVDGQNGYLVSSGGKILKTSNGGSTWLSQSSGTLSDLKSIHFIDAQIGWAVGASGTIVKTSNGGSSWQLQSSGFFGDIFSVHFADAQNGLAVGWLGQIVKTTNGGSSWQIQNSGTNNHLYSVHFSDPLHGWAVGANGTILTTITNNQINPETPTTLLTGNLFEKTTANCNPSNIPVSNRKVKAIPGPYYGMSDNQGKFNLRLPLADTATSFILKALEYSNPAFTIEVVCPINNQHIVNLDTIPDTLSGKDFGFEIIPCHQLDVQIASDRRRRCFENTTSISYQNQGSHSASDAYVLVEFPKWVRPVSASRSYVALNDSVWRFNLDSVSAGESGWFTITDSVLCDNVEILGLSQCTKATIYPAPNCPSSNWNGASLSASGICAGSGIVRLNLSNNGTGDMLDSTTYSIYLDSILVSQKRLKLVQNDSIVFQVQANGKSVRLQADQPSNHPTQNSITLNVEGCGQSNQNISKGFVNKFPLAQSPNSKTHCLPIMGAYDPNDKQVFPIGFTDKNIIAPNTRLEYLVRFQNTGNDTAFTVYVIDTLDQNLNPETFEMGAVSHNYQLSMQTVRSGKTFLRWQFNNIQLPDSSTNQLKSNGFIQYRISPKPNLALGTKVRNHAEIYFDFNSPIFTNQTLSTYDIITYTDPNLNGSVEIVTGIPGQLSPKQIGVNLYPNPVTEHSFTADFQTKGSLTLFNAQGQMVYEKLNIEGKQVLPIQLRTGLYMAQLKTAKGVSMVKVVVE